MKYTLNHSITGGVLSVSLSPEKAQKCPLCNDTGIRIENLGYCGGCEQCGTLEERETPCQCINQKN